MLDRKVVREFLDEELKETEIPDDISKETLTETFCKYVAVQAGPGKIQCASATQLIIDKFELDFIFDVGASGSLSGDLNLYDIVCGEHSFEYDICPI